MLPGRLIAPEHRVQVSLGSLQQSVGGSVQAAPRASQSAPILRVTQPVRPAARPHNHLASVVVHIKRQRVRHSRPVSRARVHLPARPVVQHAVVPAPVAPKA